MSLVAMAVDYSPAVLTWSASLAELSPQTKNAISYVVLGMVLNWVLKGVWNMLWILWSLVSVNLLNVSIQVNAPRPLPAIPPVPEAPEVCECDDSAGTSVYVCKSEIVTAATAYRTKQTTAHLTLTYHNGFACGSLCSGTHTVFKLCGKCINH